MVIVESQIWLILATKNIFFLIALQQNQKDDKTKDMDQFFQGRLSRPRGL